MPTSFSNHYRCPDELAEFGITGALSAEAGYFTFRDAICYGRQNGGPGCADVTETLPDVSDRVEHDGTQVRLPFDLSEIVTNLQQERYCTFSEDYLQKFTASTTSQNLYYMIRPFLPVPVRKHLQKLRLSGWDRIAFPRWPVDFTVETLMERTMALVLKSSGLQKMPFVWFWPDGAPSCGMMTHDVEDRAGRDFCDHLMDLNDSYGVKSSFQLIPEVRYEVSASLLDRFRSRGFEVNVHDLNHDGRLFHNRKQFLQRASRINDYVKAFGSRGFRAGAMYRQQQWFDALEISYDMSVPNVAHLEPQRGGCCTVMPYFVGGILELPLTTIQDYSLFHILGDYSINVWKQQIDLIMARNGLISFIAHPDYLIDGRAREVYMGLLAHLRRLRDERKVWMALPGDVDRWWRSRSQMTLVKVGNSWCIEGPDRERARLAYATLENDRLVYKMDGVS
jgi:hypothetical protein